MKPGEVFIELLYIKIDYLLSKINVIKEDEVFSIMNSISVLCDFVLEARRRDFFENEDYKYLSLNITQRLEELIDKAHLFYNNKNEIYLILQRVLNSWIKERYLLPKEIQ